jgi:hypothetical protein
MYLAGIRLSNIPLLWSFGNCLNSVAINISSLWDWVFGRKRFSTNLRTILVNYRRLHANHWRQTFLNCSPRIARVV